MYVKSEYGALVNLNKANGVYVSRENAPMGCEQIVADFGKSERNYTLATYDNMNDALFAITVLGQYVRDKAKYATMDHIRLIVETDETDEEDVEK